MTNETYNWGELRSMLHGDEPTRVFSHWRLFDDAQKTYTKSILGLSHLTEAEIATKYFRLFVDFALNCEQSPDHESMCREIQTWADSDEPFVLVLNCPRRVGKSTYCRLVALWLMVRGSFERLFYSCFAFRETQTQITKIRTSIFAQWFMRFFPSGVDLDGLQLLPPAPSVFDAPVIFDERQFDFWGFIGPALVIGTFSDEREADFNSLERVRYLVYDFVDMECL